MTKKVNVSPEAIVELLGLSGHVVQNAYYDGNNSFSMFAQQYNGKNHSNVILKSTDDPAMDYLNNNFDNHRKVHFDQENPYLEINDSENEEHELSGHSQTLIARDGFIITGTNKLNTTNTIKILQQWQEKTGNNYVDLLNSINTDSARETIKAINDQNSDSSKIHWTNRLGVFRQYDNIKDSNESVKLGEYVLLTGIKQVIQKEIGVTLNSIKRIEAAADVDSKYLLIAANSDEKLYLLVFDYGSIRAKITNKLDDIGLERSIYYSEDGNSGHVIPDGDVNLTGQETKNAVDWIQSCLKVDDFVVNIEKEECLACTMLDTKMLMKNMDQNPNEPSYQGFTIDSDKNIYIASGRGPSRNSKANDYSNRILCVPDFGYDLQNATYFTADYHDLEYYLKQVYGNDFGKYYLEIEGIQNLYEPAPNHSLGIIFGVHDTTRSQNKTVHNIYLKYKLTV